MGLVGHLTIFGAIEAANYVICGDANGLINHIRTEADHVIPGSARVQ